MSTVDGFPPISDYAFISDCHSLALVARDGSIEWAVFHRWDGRPVFAGVLDRNIGGFFKVAPTSPEAETGTKPSSAATATALPSPAHPWRRVAPGTKIHTTIKAEREGRTESPNS